jgi:hypothetical protein
VRSEYTKIILPVVLFGYQTWFLTVREQHRLRVLGPKRDEVVVTGGDCMMGTFMICTFY